MSSSVIDNEAMRLNALRDLRLLNSAPSESFDRLTRMASTLFGLPVAAISLTDSDRQWFKSRIGVDHWSIPRDKAPCAEVAESLKVVVIEDFLEDPCYRDSVLARGGVRFYAGAPLKTADGFGLGAICVLGTEPRQVSQSELDSLQDLASMVMAQIELQHAFGRIDQTSGLPNRVQFLEDYDDLARDCAGEQRLVSLIDLIGVDQFNHATRVLGPLAVDDMLKEAARNVRTIIGEGSTAYHVGIMQLASLAPKGTSEDDYKRLLESKVEALRILGGANAMGTPVIGVAHITVGDMPLSDVLRLAQGAAQDARAAGKIFAFHSIDQDIAFRRRFKILRDFEAASVDFSAMRLVYQPRIDKISGRCTGVEALMRWTHPTLGDVSPGEFIPLIEQSALATPTTAWVIATAVKQLSAWQTIGLDLQLSVNVSTANLREPNFAGFIQRIVAENGIAAASLELEITETAIMSDAEVALTQVKHLAATGIRIAIDDFGTGYSSLSYLQRLPVHVVKIDRSFMQDVDTDPRQLSLVTMMIAMSKHLGYRVVAEGVETAQVVDRLRMTDCDEFQGFFFARPMSPDDLMAWLRREKMSQCRETRGLDSFDGEQAA